VILHVLCVYEVLNKYSCIIIILFVLEMSDKISAADQLEIDAAVNSVLRGINGGSSSKSKQSFASITEKVIGNQTSSQSSASSRKKVGNLMEQEQARSSLYDHSTGAAAPALVAERKKWEKTYARGLVENGLKPLEMDDKLKRDIKVIQMRNYMDPKRFYKNPDKMGAILGVGTVIEGAAEYKSHRINRKDRKQTIVEEVMADRAIKGYTKNRFAGIQEASARAKGRNKKGFKAAKKGMGKMR
jgi:hypothetical protein